MPDCVDLFFQTCLHSWHYLEWSIASGKNGSGYATAWNLYHSSLARLIEAGQRYGRLDPSSGLSVNTPSGPLVIPIAYHGFAWGPQDFDNLVLVEDYGVPELSRAYRRYGVGVPLVVVRQRECEERFHDRRHHFAATAILRPSLNVAVDDRDVSILDGSRDETTTQRSLTLEFHDPLRTYTVECGNRQFPLSTDTTAPLALLLSTRKRNYLQEFLQPGQSGSKARLIMVEPYQPGKIPLVFVHGLLSDPLTWVDLANEIRANPHLIDRYQLWAFEYPTGEPFLRSAATLRSELRAALNTLDPQHGDPALAQMVLVGHSMGGLISRLQVTHSSNTLWNSVANRPLEGICATRPQRDELRELFFFDPLSCVKRVVFIATPHRGSSWANRLIGRLGASLVNAGQERKMDHQQLIDNNPNTFSRHIRKRIPTSVDLLEPGNPILESIQRLCVNPEAKLHSIIGTGKSMLIGGPADGVVPVSSARLAGVETERFVPTDHEHVHRHPDTVNEIICILKRHHAEFDRTMAAQSDDPAGA